MLFSKLFLLCLLYCICSASEEDNVLNLTDVDFEAKIAQYDNALVLFYAPWCGHCQKLKPEFAKASADLVRNKPPVQLAQIDCTQGGKQTCEKYEIGGYPTLKIFRKGEFIQNYQGTRDSENIVKVMKAHVGSHSKEITSVDDLEMFLAEKNKVAIVGFFDKNLDLRIALAEVSKILKGKAEFGQCSKEAVLKEQGISDGIVLFRPKHMRNKFENDSVFYSGPAVAEDIKKFIYKNCHGLVGHRKKENTNDFKTPLVVVYYNIDYERNFKATNYWRNRVLKVAAQHENKINFAISNRDDFQHELLEVDVSYERDDKPTVLARDAENRKYVMKNTFSVENLDHFVEKLIKNELKPYVKSEPVPKSNDESVKVAVANNFDSVVIENKKDTLIAFYAPWCGHCKRLAPLYEELGNKLKNEDIDIVKMDATANDIPAMFRVEGYPTVYWVPKESKNNPVVYDGPREINDLIKFIAEKATEELKGYDRQGIPKEDKSQVKMEL